jgi:hypothetical protein
MNITVELNDKSMKNHFNVLSQNSTEIQIYNKLELLISKKELNTWEVSQWHSCLKNK